MREHNRKAGAEKSFEEPVKAGTVRNEHTGITAADYSVYRCSRKEWLLAVGQYLVLDGAAAYLFFNSWTAFTVLLPGIYLFLRERKNELRRKRQEEMKRHFMDAVQLMSASLQAGYSAENAFREAGRELHKVYGAESCVVREFRRMEQLLSMNRNLEELLLDFGRRSGVDDIKSFAEVFLTARRTGGDLLSVIRNTVFCIRQKQETMQEIETCLAGKKMEQNIMSMIPLLILGYVRLTSPEFIEGMYGNTVGTAVMAVCFLVYAGAYFWGRRIVEIEV